ncbi:aldo/keto reductase family protein [Asticcacaulis biprosthecium C19]|uniref:Aldo/keto reductase family protein n=1 Tax=Asticcacaulis biprosthecium C19 TaxID=715226 RepID=F4QKP3_9CAUL|nr:aldo/keto reductase [Asticcacaulis biprosthecium]EGF93345.1 aldo/keto reductase family protein [Asticcacaulis biprosthecium C19]
MSLTSSLPRNTIGTTAVSVTALGFGAAGIGNLYRTVADEDAEKALDYAFRHGIAYVDTAPHYGQGLSERRVGANLPTRASLSTKVGRVLDSISPPPPGTERHGFVDGDPFEPRFDYSYDGIMRSFEASTARLKRDYIDILLCHDIGEMPHGDNAAHHTKIFLNSGYRAMDELKAARNVGAIGLGVNETGICLEVLPYTDLDTILLAGRYTLLEQGALDELLPECLRRKVSIILGGPFNSGILVGDNHYNYGAAPEDVVKKAKALGRLCADHGVPLPAAALQFPLAHPAVACVIPGMVSAGQVETNLELFHTDIPAELWNALKHEGLLHEDAPTPQDTKKPVVS